jgi:2-keto-4-pentenoate hydratase
VALTSVEAAYRAQAEAAGMLKAKYGGLQVGYKVGATNAAAQARMGLTEPFYGPLFTVNLRMSPAAVSAGKNGYRLRGVEAEYGFLLADGLPARERPYTRDEVAARVAAVYPTIEVCGSRFAEPPPAAAAGGGAASSPPLATLVSIADQASHGCLVRGVRFFKPMEDWVELTKPGFAHLPVHLRVNDALVATGTGADVLGDPLTSLVWLANAVRGTSAPLKAGDTVITGTMTGLTPVKPGDRVVADFVGFGEVAVTIEE